MRASDGSRGMEPGACGNERRRRPQRERVAACTAQAQIEARASAEGFLIVRVRRIVSSYFSL